MSKQVQQAEKKVTKALTVFNQAITEVETANKLLTEAVKQDSMKVQAIRNQIASLETQIVKTEKSKADKGKQIKSNEQLLEKLKEFKA